MMRKPAIVTCSFFLVVAVVLWIVSWVWLVELAVYRSNAGREITVTHVGGRISVMVHRWTPPRQETGSRLMVARVSDIEQRMSILPMMTSLRERPSFEWRAFNIPHRGSTWTGFSFAFPHWLVFVHQGTATAKR